MAKTSTARLHNYICPLCGERLASDDKGLGFVRHLEPPPGPEIFDNTDKIKKMLQDGDLEPDFMDFYEKMVQCPFQAGQRDGVSAWDPVESGGTDARDPRPVHGQQLDT